VDSKPLSVIVLGIAFVALVLPFDSVQGAVRTQTRSPFLSGLEAIQGLGDWARGPREAKQFNIEVQQ
jgi:hypothetical protein